MLRLLNLEKQTLLKGWLLSAIIIFPFTFLPVLFKEGALSDRLLLRIPESALYSAVFAAIIVIAAFSHNYRKLKIKIDLFQKPAFAQLGFDHFTEGYKSLVDELNLVLRGNHKGILFEIRIDIDMEDYSRKSLLIKPWLSAEVLNNRGLSELRQEMKRDFKLSYHRLEVISRLEEEKLDDPTYVIRQLNLIGTKFKIPLSPK